MSRLIPLLIFLVVSCSPIDHKPSVVRLPRTPEMEQAFQKGERLFLAKQYPEAEVAYRSYLQQYPYNFFTPQVYYRLGETKMVEKKWGEAIPNYKESLNKGIFPDWGAKAIYQMAICYHRLEDVKNTFFVLDQLPHDADPSLRVRAGSLRVAAAKKGKDPVEEAAGYLELVEAYNDLPPAEREVGDLAWVVDYKESLASVREWVDAAAVSMDELKRLMKRFSGQDVRGYILWKAVRTSHQTGDYQRAASLAQRYLSEFPKQEYVPSARILLAELGKRETGYRARIGVILPLTGPYGVYGTSVLHGLECAAGIFNPCRGDLGVTLEIRDSGSDPQRAVRELRELASDGEVIALVGPLSQGEADAVAPVVEELQIPTIVLSQKPDVAAKGDYLFRNFLTAADQVATLVDYACRDKKLKQFAILYPAGEGGEEYRKRFEQEVSDCGGEVVAKEGYSPGTDNFLDPLRKLKNAKGRHEWGEKGPFQALFFPDIYLRVPDLISALRFLNIEGVQLLGGPGWDHPDLASADLKGFEAVFVNGFFPKGGGFTTKDFVASFQDAYGVEPTLLEAYAYDSLRLLGSVLHGTATISRPEIQKELAQVKSFNGVTGNISFDGEGDARRRLFLLTVKGGEIQELR